MRKTQCLCVHVIQCLCVYVIFLILKYFHAVRETYSCMLKFMQKIPTPPTARLKNSTARVLTAELLPQKVLSCLVQAGLKPSRLFSAQVQLPLE